MTLKSLLQKPASKNAAASYLAFASSALWGLASIPLAVTYLKPEQIGLWAIVNALLGYLAWADLGIGPAIGRIMAPSISKGDQIEMNRWWTVTRAALFILGMSVIAIGQLLCLVIQPITQCTEEVIGDARLLLGGGAVILGLTFPIRGVAGILIAEHRYHWAPLIQAVSPWINFLVFFLLLKMGHGLKAYLFAFVASQSFNWFCFKILIAKGPNQFSWDKNGIRINRFRKLLTFSSNIAITAGIESIIRTLPILILAQVASLAVVPLYSFSSRFAMLGSNLMIQTTRAFYPGLQKLYINKETSQFRARHNSIVVICLGMATAGAALSLLANSAIVQLLAGKEYYAGKTANIWFSASIITITFSNLFRILLPISGNMGKASLIAILKLLIAVIASKIAWNQAGISGIAATLAILPLLDGLYSYYRGTQNCGYLKHQISSIAIPMTLFALLLIYLAGAQLQRPEECDYLITLNENEIYVSGFYKSWIAFATFTISTILTFFIGSKAIGLQTQREDSNH